MKKFYFAPAHWGVLMLAVLLVQPTMAENPIAIAIHGGAGTILKQDLSDEKEASIRADLEAAVKAGYAILEGGGSSTEAVLAAITLLEDSPNFNAGKGAVLNQQGNVELDASIMRGEDRQAGAIAGVYGVKNPILLAHKVMTVSPHVLLSGEGAETFAKQNNIQFENADYFKTPYRIEQLKKIQDQEKAQADLNHNSNLDNQYKQSWFSTVGTVAVDKFGNLAAGTSTGGTANKRWGRIGDSPIIGAGTYADDRYCAVSATGHGEYFIRAAVAHDICARVAYQQLSINAAAEQVINQDLVAMGGDGGIIAVAPDGEIAMVFNTPGMYRASVDKEGKVTVAIYKQSTDSENEEVNEGFANE